MALGHHTNKDVVEIGWIAEVVARGFGLGRSVVAPPRATSPQQDIFLNESRIASLGGAQEALKHPFVLMTLRQSEGQRIAANMTLPLPAHHESAAACLWKHCTARATSVPEVEVLQIASAAGSVVAPLAILTVTGGPGMTARLGQYLSPLQPDASRQLDLIWEQFPQYRHALLAIIRALARFQNTATQQHWALRGATHQPDDRHWLDLLLPTIKTTQTGWPARMKDWEVVDMVPAADFPTLLRHAQPDVWKALVALAQVLDSDRRRAMQNADEVFSTLDADDHALANLWSQASEGQQSRGFVLAQMLSARAAEKAAARYFQGLALPVEDVAHGQLQSADDRWTMMDLQISGKHGVDVKNLRRTPHGRMSSSRWRVKAFKSDAKGADVLLCGVSSPYTTLADGTLSADSPTETIQVLGVTGARQFASLMRAFGSFSGIRIVEGKRMLELPAWAWDYPHAHYNARDAALTALRALVADKTTTRLQRRTLQALPPALLALWDVSGDAWRQDLSPRQVAFLQTLQHHHRSQSPSAGSPSTVPRLPWLYLMILHDWARRRLADETADTGALVALFESPLLVEAEGEVVDTRARLYDAMRARSTAKWLGIVDPAGTVKALLSALQALESKLAPQHALPLSDLRLLQNGVLVGMFPDGRQRTLLAHCGGRLPSLVECGNRPLIFGTHVTCSCGRLICSKCSCCSDGRYSTCDVQDARLAKLPTRQGRTWP